MSSRTTKLLPLVLIPLVLYGAAKGLLYYKVKSTMDDIVLAASNKADIRYGGIETDLTGAVTVKQISVVPRGSATSVDIDAVRISSDDPMFFIHGTKWSPGENAPPPRLGFSVSGITLPFDSQLFSAQAAVESVAGQCVDGVTIGPDLLQRIGFSELTMDVDGRYDLNESERTLTVEFGMDLHDIESIHFDATLVDVDVGALRQGAPPALSLGEFMAAIRVEPAFGRQLLKTCAIGSDQGIEAWSEHLAKQFIEQLAAQGLQLGHGLRTAVHRFHHEWGEISFQSRPAKPIGLLSLMFVPPKQLVGMLGLHVRLNDEPIADNSFDWQQAEPKGLGALFGARPQDNAGDDGVKVDKTPKRRLMRREYQSVAASSIGGLIDRRVRVKPRGQPSREGVLKGVANGEAEIEQTLHGGKFTVYVPLAQIESLQVQTLREVSRD